MGWWVACSPCSRAARARRAFGSGTFREFRAFLFGAFWLDPGEGCENMLRAATENTRREAQRTARRTRAKHQEAPRSQRGESIASIKIASVVGRVQPLLARCARSPGVWI